LRIRMIGDKEEIQASGEKPTRSGLAHDDVDDVRAIEAAALTEELLLAVIVALRAKVKIPAEAAVGLDSRNRVLERPAGKSTGAMLDVVLSVIANAHREQLEQLAAVILVVDILGVELVIQPEEHGGVFR